VFITVQYNDYRANYTDEYVSDVFVLEVSAPKTVIQINSADNSIYTYHTALFNFDFFDTNHSIDLTGAVVDVWFNVTDVSAIVTPSGSSYQVEITSNNPYTIGISVYINVTKTNYESINNYLLGEINVVIIQTEIVSIDVPSDMYDGYNTSVIILFNDTDNVETIDGAYLESIVTNSTSFVNISIVELGGGQYNITFINYDIAVFWLDMNITLAKPGYYNAVIRITIKIIVVQTDSELLDSSSVSIYYDTGTTFDILYWDNISFVNITNPQVFFSGNLTGVVTPSYSFLDNITTITILTITDLGYYELNITIVKPGFEPQIISVYILVQERQTSVDSDETDITFYADLTDNILLNYTDELDEVSILVATVDIDFAADNSTLIVQDYFNINLVEVGSLYEITFDPIENMATGYVFIFNMTISKYGYVTNFIIITVTINIHPTDIDPSSTSQDTVYTDEDGEFTIIYETIEDDFISGAEMSYILINGTSAEIEDVVLTQIIDTYVIYVYISSSIIPELSFEIELTFYKYGFENQTWIILITVAIHPTDIDPSSTSQDTVYTDEDGEFTIIYETIEDDFISGAEMSYSLLNGTSAEIEDVVLTQIIDSYVIYVYISSSIVPELSFEIELTFYKHGFENQTWIILITVAIHLTDIDPSSDNQDTIYTDGVGNYTIIYETIEDDFISGAEMSYILINGTSMDIENVALSQILGSYVVDIYINSSIVPVTSFLIELTFYKHGYENQTWIITINIINHPTDIDPSSDNQDTINTEEDGEFTIVYETEEGDFISGAELSYILINGTSMDIENVALSQILDSYIVSVYINSSIVPVTSFLIELTFYKHGFENQTWIITLTVAIHPTSIDPSEDQDTIYADEDGEFTIVYETEEGDFITGAEMEYNIINGTSAEILLITYSPITDYYLIFINFDESLVAGKNFSIELIFYKHGFQNQTCIININVLPKITYDIILEIVGELRQLNTIQFQITLSNFSIDLLTALSFENIKFYTNPNGDFALITYIFTFANGTTKEYQIQAEFQQISEGVFVALTSEITIPWRVTEVSYIATYTPTSQSVISIESTSISESLTQNPKILELLSYMFTEFTPYMAAALAVIAAVFISLTIFFGVIRPRKQKRSAKKRGYLDKISKILASVISMRKVIVVHNETGLPVYEWDLGGEISVDSSLVSGFLQAVSGMGGEISGGEVGAVRKIDYGQFCVSSAGTDCITTYLFSTGDISADVEIGLASFVEWFEKKFHDLVSTTWDGKTEEFLSNERSIIDTLSENLFVWTLHPLSVNTVKEKDVLKLGTFSQKLYKFIKDYNEVSISVALEFFGKQPMEETLSKIFEMVDANILLRKRLR
ncbi:MAG: hypothetical protein HGN29_12020, partial [Asgard group archaeon]|nr:hypothetical protein [Asgard group archaeon]